MSRLIKQMAVLFVSALATLPTYALDGDTLVPTKTGHKAIKDIQLGELVLSKNETTNQVDYQSVSNLYNDQSAQTVYVSIGDNQGNFQTLKTSKTHPFFVQSDDITPSSEGYVYQGDIKNANWTDASSLKVGDKLLSENGTWQTVQSVQINQEPITAYHLTVNNNQTFFVTANGGTYGAWVHNNNICYLPKPITAEQRRQSAGKAFSSTRLVELKMGESLFKGGNSAPVPKQVADKLSCRSFANFTEFRQAFWKEMANDPAVARNFNNANIASMKKGNAPFAPDNQHNGGNARYELDHDNEIQDGGTIYNMDNIIIRTPLDHARKTREKQAQRPAKPTKKK